VEVTPRLLNSYLSVHYVHSPLRDAQELFKTLFDEFGVKQNAHSFVDALERCGISKKPERATALAFSEGLWDGWRVLEDGWESGKRSESRVDARMIERAYIAMIRILSL
jgi:hypothetical protein